MSEHIAGPNQIRGIAARLCWEHPGYGEFISKKDASDALYQYADEMESDTVRQAALDLLLAAKGAASKMAFEDERDHLDDMPSLELQRLRAAIAKAEGGGV